MLVLRLEPFNQHKSYAFTCCKNDLTELLAKPGVQASLFSTVALQCLASSIGEAHPLAS